MNQIHKRAAVLLAALGLPMAFSTTKGQNYLAEAPDGQEGH